MRGLFITFEGPEGSGKTTQAARLVARLRAEGRPVAAVREPGGTPTGEAIREILQHDRAGEPIAPEAEVLLFEASRAQLVRTVIRPAMQAGAHVVCDRFSDSTTAYQGYGRGLDVEAMLRLNAFAAGGLEPDLTLLLDVDIPTGFARLGDRSRKTLRGRDRFEREDREFHRRVRAGYLALAERWPARFRRLDGDGGEDAVASAVWDIVDERIRMRGASGPGPEAAQP